MFFVRSVTLFFLFSSSVSPITRGVAIGLESDAERETDSVCVCVFVWRLGGLRDPFPETWRAE